MRNCLFLQKLHQYAMEMTKQTSYFLLLFNYFLCLNSLRNVQHIANEKLYQCCPCKWVGFLPYLANYMLVSWFWNVKIQHGHGQVDGHWHAFHYWLYIEIWFLQHQRFILIYVLVLEVKCFAENWNPNILQFYVQSETPEAKLDILIKEH